MLTRIMYTSGSVLNTSSSFMLNRHVIQDERYTVSYIEREAFLILKYVSSKKRDAFGVKDITLSDRDYRILKRWRIR